MCVHIVQVKQVILINFTIQIVNEKFCLDISFQKYKMLIRTTNIDVLKLYGICFEFPQNKSVLVYRWNSW